MGHRGEEYVLRKRDFIKKIQERGYEKYHGTGNKTMISGIGLKDKPEELETDLFD